MDDKREADRAITFGVETVGPSLSAGGDDQPANDEDNDDRQAIIRHMHAEPSNEDTAE